ncbi:MAG: hypothetical protein GY854_03235 [Deltaproteobacteria bacterium]|nr:hypothetical protein [Deltaproteobacteria bacterium]
MLTIIAASVAWARDADQESSPETKPVVLVLAIAPIGEERDFEKQFATQVALSLPDFQVNVLDTGLGFASSRLPERLQIIKPLTETHGSVATLWIEKPSEDLILLHLVALRTGRALVRIVEADDGPEAILELALAAQELLGQAYQLERGPREPAVTHVVSKVTEAAVLTLPPPDTEPESPEPTSPLKPPIFWLYPFGEVDGGITGYDGNVIHIGGGLGGVFHITSRLFLSVSSAFLSSLRDRHDWGNISSACLRVELSAGYAWALGRFRLGPIIGFAPVWNKVDIDLKTTGNHHYSWWSGRMFSDLGLRLSISKSLYLALDPGVGVLPKRKTFSLDPEARTIHGTPRVDWRIRAGLVIGL